MKQFIRASREHFFATALGIAIGVGGMSLFKSVSEHINAMSPAVKLVISQPIYTDGGVTFNLSGARLRGDCGFAGMHGVTVGKSVNPGLSPSTLTWLTPSSDFSLKPIGVMIDLGTWRLHPVAPGDYAMVIETSVCNNVIITDKSNMAKP